MASTQITTVTDAVPFAPQARAIELAGTRLYVAYQNGSNLVYRYSDDDGGTWSSETTVASGSSLYPAGIVYDSTNSRLEIAYAGGNSITQKLAKRAITSNVTSGTPGSLNTETVIDAGTSSTGVSWAYMFSSPTVTNPRLWIIGSKVTGASTYETRAWYVAMGSSSDTAGNWTSSNFQNLGSNSNSETPKHGIGVHWTISGNDRVTLIFGSNQDAPFDYEAVTFDPTATTPTPGTVTADLFNLAGSGSTFDTYANGPGIALAGKADYLVFGRLDRNTGTWDFFKSTNGTSWTTPSGWTGLTMGRAQITKSSSDFYIVHTDSYGAISTTAQTLRYRKITTSSDTMGGVTTFSDTSGNPVTVPLNTGTSKLYGVYRGGTSSAFTFRSDFVSIGGAADTTAPSAATVSVAAVSATAIYLSATMPADVDVAEYEVRYLTGSTAPATDRSNGTVSTSPTSTSANAAVTPSITGLTSGTRITGRVFVKDTAGNWNTGAEFTAVPVTVPALTYRLRADGTTIIADGTSAGGNNVILEFQLDDTDFETGGANAHFRFRIGYDNATPPTQSFFDMTSNSADGSFKYESAPSTWTTVPSSGLTSSNWTSKLRVYTSTTQTSQYGSLRVEQ